MSTSNQLTQFWIELLELYRSMPQLWDVGHEDYVNRFARHNAYRLMLEKYQEFDEGATIDNLKKRISNMRASFRREYRKVKQDNSYRPMLWYYSHLEFLKDQEESPNDNTDENFSSSGIKREDIELKYLPPPRKRKESDNHAPVSKRQSTNRLPQKPSKCDEQYSHVEITPMASASPHSQTTGISGSPPYLQSSKQNSDEARTLCAAWEVQYRKLHPQQKLYANRVITEVLYMGALQQLRPNTYKTFEDFSNPSEHQDNPLNNLNENGMLCDQVLDINDALSAIRELENFAGNENLDAIELLMQLEEVLKNPTEHAIHVNEDEDDKDYEPGDDFIV